MNILSGAQSQAGIIDRPAGDKGRATRPSRLPWLWAALLLSSLLAAPLTAALAQTTPSVSVFAPAAATATAQAQAATTQAANGDCPTGNVCVSFGAFAYALDPTCLDQVYVTSLRSVQDAATGADVVYVNLLTFLKAGDDGWIIIPQPENVATGAVAGKPLGSRLCAGVEGAK